MSNTTNTSNDANTTGNLVLLRHGQTVWSESGQYTGRTNIPLTAVGEQQAKEAGERLRAMFPHGFAASNIYTSDLRRAMETARLAGFTEHEVTPDLEEWDYGRAEGRTRAQISSAIGYDWDVWDHGPHAIDEQLGGQRVEVFPDGQTITVVNGEGEGVEEAAARARGIIEHVMPAVEAGQDVLFVAHAHILRILTTQWLDVDPLFGRKLKLDTAHISVLSIYKGDHVIRQWNC